MVGVLMDFSILQIYSYMVMWRKLQNKEDIYLLNLLFGSRNQVWWKLKKQYVVTKTSVDVEYQNVANTIFELDWLRSKLCGIHSQPLDTIVLFCDNQAALYITSNSVFHERTKYIKLDCHEVWKRLVFGFFTTLHVKTQHQLADLFTKADCTSVSSFAFQARNTLLLSKLKTKEKS